MFQISALTFFFRRNRIHFLLLQLGMLIFSSGIFAQTELVLKGQAFAYYDLSKSRFIVIDDSTSYHAYNEKLAKFERFDLKFVADTTFQFFRNSFFPISTPDDGTYFVHYGCGVVYHFIGDSIYRHDASFFHRNQFMSYYFQHENQIMTLGGYGMFTEKNILVQYNKLSRDWLLVPYKNEAPPGFKDPLVQRIDKLLYLLAYKNHGDADFRDELYTYDLKINAWTKLGRQTERFSQLLNSDKQAVVVSNSMMRVKNGVVSFDVKTNTASFYENPIFATTYQIVENPNNPELVLLIIVRQGAHELIAKVAHKDDLFKKLIDTFPVWELEREAWNPLESKVFLSILALLFGVLLGGISVHLFWRKRSVKKVIQLNIQDIVLPKKIENDLLQLFLASPNHSLEVSSVNALVDEENISTEALKKRRERLLKEFCFSLATIYNTEPDQILHETKHPKDGRIKILELSKALFIR
jgi:hypothetical protein